MKINKAYKFRLYEDDKELLGVFGFIYITTNLINGKKYIGKRKFSQGWEKYIGSGVVFLKAVEKHKIENFKREIVHLAYNENELNQLEIEYILNHNASNSDEYYNISLGGNGGNTFSGKTESEIKIIGEKISNSNKGKIFSLETREKLSIANRGVNSHLYGKHLSKQTKEKLSMQRKGKFCDGENPNAKAVICITTNEKFQSASSASVFTGVPTTNIIKCCRKKLKSAGKHPITKEKLIWEYI